MIQFQPIYQTRVWGGRELERKFSRVLPDAENPYGESWEISARDEADSVVITPGYFEGKKLSELWDDEDLRPEFFGENSPQSERFPLLCKVLDAREKLSVQVHPPAAIADDLGGEPKTETWFIADADPGAEIYVGVKAGVTKEDFNKALVSGTVDDCVHRIPVQTGDHIFIPSGRLHAIGAGIVIYEIQQNSDTTYRVFDWSRVGLDGKPRDLHIEESLACIDFDDVEPEMDSADGAVICECDYFKMERHTIEFDEDFKEVMRGRFGIVTVIKGRFDGAVKGDFFMLPAGNKTPSGSGEILLTTWP